MGFDGPSRTHLPGVAADVAVLDAAAVLGLELFHDLDRQRGRRENDVHGADERLHVGRRADQVAHHAREVLRTAVSSVRTGTNMSISSVTHKYQDIKREWGHKKCFKNNFTT